MDKKLEKEIEVFNRYLLEKYGFELRKGQIQAANALTNENLLVHMLTGEGKTVAIAFAVYLALLQGRRVYVVTVNDYLADRDREQFREFFEELGYKTTLNKEIISNAENQDIHTGDVIYTSVQNLSFDYVRDEFNDYGVKFDLDLAILDEIDYVLLDNANTQFSVGISGGKHLPLPDIKLMDAIWAYSESINEDNYEYDAIKKEVDLAEEVYKELEAIFNVKPDDEGYATIIYYCETALRAKFCYFNGIDYFVEDDGVVGLLNKYNGRSLRNSKYDFELDYFIRKKEEGVQPFEPVSVQNTMGASILFRKFKNVVGISGTTKYAVQELTTIIGCSGVRVIKPASRILRIEKKIKVKTKTEKYKYIGDFIMGNRDKYAFLIICDHEQEVLNTVNGLSELGIENIRTLTNHVLDKEQELIDDAGKVGNILVSSRLVGRGTDIISDAPFGLCVFVTHKGADMRTDIQAKGRTGRNGSRGLAFLVTSSEDRKEKIDFEEMRKWMLFEDILLEGIKGALLEWVKENEKNGLSKEIFVPLWLDFNKSMRGRIVKHYATPIETVHGACLCLKAEVKFLMYDIAQAVVDSYRLKEN